jgi:hypothetical protein
MDAGSGHGAVRVRLALHSAKDLPDSNRLAVYFQRLRAPLVHRDIDFDGQGVPVLDGGFLVCEDFGTRGLGGDPLLSRDPPASSEERQDFFWFWRNIGRSGKTGDDLGRWGLGKTVYRAASRISCMLGLTVRESDQRQLLMGQAVLKIHDDGGQEYAPEGFFCSDTDAAGLPLPLEDPAVLRQFRRDWKLTRNLEPGLSIVVPYAATELTGKRLLQAVCIHFFLPILQSQLVVELAAPDLPPHGARLDRDSLRSWCQSLSWDGPKRAKRHSPPPVDFVRECLQLPQPTAVTEFLGRAKVPELTGESFAPEVLALLRTKLDREELLRISVRLLLPRRSGEPASGELTVFLQRRNPDQRSDTYYIREGMTITRLNSKAAFRGIQAVVLVDKGPLAQLLGDSEGPSHEAWDTSEERPDKLWKNWKGRVTFCRKIVDLLLDVLEAPPEQRDFNLLSDFFSIEEVGEKRKTRVVGDSGEQGSGFGSIAAVPRWYRVDARRGGFRIAASGSIPVPENAVLHVRLAYDLHTGNPLKRWSPFDFDLQKTPSRFTMNGQHVTHHAAAGNLLTLNCSDAKFWFSVEGFDQHADLYVRVDEGDLE